MNELTAPALKRKMDPLAMSNDSAMLRQLTAELNDPRLTGAVVPPEERVTPNTRAVTAAPPSAVPAPISSEVPIGMTAEAADRLRAQMVLQQSQSIAAIPGAPDAPKIQLSTAPVPASPQPAPRHQPAQRIFFTGHPLVGKKWLAEKIGAHVIGFDDPIRNLAFNAFGEQPEEKLAPFIATIRAFGRTIPRCLFPWCAPCLRTRFGKAARRATQLWASRFPNSALPATGPNACLPEWPAICNNSPNRK
jgi:hypothetical protein